MRLQTPLYENWGYVFATLLVDFVLFCFFIESYSIVCYILQVFRFVPMNFNSVVKGTLCSFGGEI